MIEKTWPEIDPIILYNATREFVSFLISISRFVLLETLLRCFTRHTNIQAFQHAIKLWVGLSKSSVLVKNLSIQFYDVNGINDFGLRMQTYQMKSFQLFVLC